MDNISRKQDADKTARNEDYQQLEEIKESLKQVNSTINELLEKNQSVCASYADAVKNLQTNTVEKAAEPPTKRIERDLTKILIVSNTKKLANSIEIKREFAKFFPLKRLVYAFNTARGNIHLEFHSSQEAEDVFNSWHENNLGTNTSIRKPSSPEQPNRSVLVRGIPTEIAEETIIDNLAKDFSNVKATRFIKKDKTVLGTVRLTFSSAEDAANAVNQGLFIDHLFYRPSYFIQQGVKIIRCYNCQKFGHVSANCNFEKQCGHCSQKHNFTDCPNKHLDPKCANCGKNHQTDSFDCQLYLNQIRKSTTQGKFLSPKLS